MKEKKHIGETSVAHNGQLMTVTGYNKSNDIEITFEDGTVISHASYENFKNGHIRNPKGPNAFAKKRIGERAVMSDGQMAEITAYRGAHDIDIRFDDGTEVMRVSYGNFRHGRVWNPAKGKPDKRGNHVGEKNVASCGMEMTIIAYRGAFDIDVEFADGIKNRHKTYTNFKKGNIGHDGPGTKTRENYVGRQKTDNNCRLMTITGYRNPKDIDISFDDGNTVRHTTYDSFKSGYVYDVNFYRRKYIGRRNMSRTSGEIETGLSTI